MVKLGRDAVHIVDVTRLLPALVVVVGLELDSRLLREHLECLAVLDLLDLHEELDRSSPVMTPETISDILRRRDHERRRLLAMKRAECLVVGPRLFHLEVPTGDIHDTQAGFYVLGDGHGVVFSW